MMPHREPLRIVDAHQHFWDLSRNYHPWLCDPDPIPFRYGDALSSLHPLHAKVGETERLFFGVGGPNFTSSFHVIGEIFDKVYNLGGVMSPPAEGIQTVTVAPGGAVITEFKLDVPGRYILVDHALAHGTWAFGRAHRRWTAKQGNLQRRDHGRRRWALRRC